MKSPSMVGQEDRPNEGQVSRKQYRLSLVFWTTTEISLTISPLYALRARCVVVLPAD